MNTKVGNIKVRSQNGEVEHLWSYLIDKYVAFPAQRLFWGTMVAETGSCLLYTSPSPRDRQKSRMPSSA